MKYFLIIILVTFAATIAAADWPPVWDYSTYMALRYQGELQVPQSTVDLIASERVLIESAFPIVPSSVLYQYWEIGRVHCALTEEAWAEFQAGGLQELRDVAAENQCLLSQYLDLLVLEIQSLLPLNSERLAELFSVIDGVRYSVPHSGYCCDGSTIEVLELGATSRYLYRRAWGDCVMGCIYKHYWEFLVSGTEVTLLDEWGTVPSETQSWGSVKAMYR